MSTDFILPDIGEGIVECEVVDWLISEGDTVVEDQPVADVMTDKALVQIPSMYTGIVEKLYYAKGDIAKVHEPLFSITPQDNVSPTIKSNVPSIDDPVVKLVEPTLTDATPTLVNELAEVKSSTELVQVEDFILPDIGEGIVECELVEWLVKEGDMIDEDQPVCDVMTDKAMVQIPSKYTGRVERLYYQKGEIATVHQPLFAIAVSTDSHTDSHSSEQSVVKNEVKERSSSDAKSMPGDLSVVQASVVEIRSGKAVASPAVRRFAREQGIDISQVKGSGKKGRVYKQDLIVHQQQVANVLPNAHITKGVESQTTQVVDNEHGSQSHIRIEPIKGIKAAMARAMSLSAQSIPHFTYCDEIDMSNLIALRSKMKDKLAKQDVKLTMMPFFMKSMSLALTEFPIVNSQPNETCTELTYFDNHNIGMAVDSPVGLIVPNIKNCQQKNMIEIAQEVARLTEVARNGRVSPEDLRDGTITISNIGAIGGTVATPIINKPQVAIVALGKVQKLPRFTDNGQVIAQHIMQVSWSGDHRVIDGGTMARFVNLWKQYLEEPEQMLMAMS